MPTLEQARLRSERRAYEAGRSGRAFSVDLDDPVPVDELQSIYDNARAERESEREPSPAGNDDPSPARRSAGRQSRSRSRSSSPRLVNDGAGFVLGLVGYALFINFVRGGRTQARAWVAAKFLNRPMGVAPSGATAAPGAAPAPSGGVGAVPGIGNVVGITSIPGIGNVVGATR